MNRILACAVAVIGMAQPAKAESVLPHAAGSLRGALTEVAAAFEAAAGAKVRPRP
jgi:ABC-type molybdate transport system substrate-binding protein